MKKITCLSVLAVFVAIGLRAQPQAFNYQAVVRNSSGEIVANQSIGIQINIRDAAANGTILYQESHSQTTNSFGLVNLKIGAGTPTIGTFSTIDWGINAKFLEVLADVTGGTNYISMGTSALESVPYALFSQNASDSYWNKVGNDILYQDGNVGVGSTDPAGKLDIRSSGAGSSVFNLSQTESSDHFTIKAGIAGMTNDAFVFNTMAGDIMTIRNGNVGIGTTSPESKLHVEGDIRIPNENKLILGTIAGGEGEYIQNVQWGIGFYSGWNEKMRINSNGNVGIGTSSPASKLDVVSPVFSSQLVSGTSAVYGIHSISGSYGWLGASNEGGYGYSPNGFGLRGQTANGYGIYGTATGTGFAGYFDGKSYFSGNVGIGTTTPAYNLDVNGTIHATSFLGDGSGLTGTGDNLGNHTATANLKMNNFWISGDGQSEGIYVNSLGNVGIGVNNPAARLSVAANAGPNLIIHDPNASNDRPGIQFTNNYIHFIGGDDGSDEYFGFYSGYGNNRIYDAVLAIYGKATDNWGKCLSLTHNGTDGRIFTDAGDIILQPAGKTIINSSSGDILLQPAGGVAINTTSAGAYKLNVNGNAYVSGSIKTATKTGYLIIPPPAFVCHVNSTGYNIDNDQVNVNDPFDDFNRFYAPVNLPHNCTVIQVDTYWKDISAGFNGNYWLYRDNILTDYTNTMSNDGSYGESYDIITVTDTSIDYPVIDNATYGYSVRLDLYTYIYFQGMRITYTYDEIK